jgi:hypothetical protein
VWKSSSSERDWLARMRVWARNERCTKHTRKLKWHGRQRRWLRPVSEWRARGGDSSQGTCLGMVVHGNVAVRSCSGVHAMDGTGGLRRDEEELSGARCS